jgi:broad specificity phosphatase PhoE
MKLVIVRHAETKANKKKILEGWNDGDLSNTGKIQAKQLAKRLAKEKIDAVYCSDLKRCKQTISPFLKIQKIPIVYTKKLRERHIGVFQGKSLQSFLKWLKKNRYEKSYSFKMPGGESFMDVKKRGAIFLDKIIKTKRNKNILIVTHATMKRAMLLYLLKKDEKKFFKKYKPKNTALSVIHIKDDGRHKARVLNSTKHLEDVA